MIAPRTLLCLLALLAAVPAAGFADQPSPRPASPEPIGSPSAIPESPSPAASPTAQPRRGRRGAVAAASPTPPSAAMTLMGLAAAMAGPQTYATFVRRTERQTGLIDIVKKDDDYYLDLGPAQFDHPYIVAPVLASGLGGDEAFAGHVFDSFVIRFKRVGRRVLWIQDNTSFSAPPDTAAANALAISVTDSVINSTPVVAEDEEKQHVIVSAAFFLSDFENVAHSLGAPAQPSILSFGPMRPAFAVDPTKSYIEKMKVLPANDEILSSLAFTGPPGDLTSAPDGRGVRLRMHYSIVDAPSASAYVPRLADDRVGYFITAQKRFDDDALSTPFVRYIDRWNFNNGPIVYYLTNEIPVQYKPSIRSALLAWNVAFAKIGIPNAIEVRDQPSAAGWDPDDARYSTVRWLTSDHPSFAAYGPHIADPRTGQILRVEIVIDGEALRSVKRGFVDQVEPTHPISRDAAGLPVRAAVSPACYDSSACDDFAEGSAELAAVGSVALRAAGATPGDTQQYAQDWLRAVVLHESGHNFGLRHNFVASTLYSLAQLHDKRFTNEHGLVGSVMEYTPLNISPAGRPQGGYFQEKLGPYDEWAIRYGYERFPSVRRPADEVLPLRGIASESSRPEYAYATDEDASGELAIDPRVAIFDLSNDPLAYDRNQFDVYDGLIAKLDTIYPRVDEPYYQERLTFSTILSGYRRAALLAARYVGGIHTSRTHRGQAGGAAPFSPVARTESRRAFDLLSQNVFSSRALHFSPRLLSDLGANHYLHRGVDDVERPDFPVEETIGDMQDAVLFAIFSPETMSRLADERYKLAPGQTTMSLDDLFGWTEAAVWDDLERPAIDPLHRALQRRYTSLLVAFSLAPTALVADFGYPSDAAPLARYELRRLRGRVERALRNPHLELATRAHLEDTDSRVKHALDPSAARGA